MGHSGNTNALVEVAGGTFRMNVGSVITGNESYEYGGGVYVNRYIRFTKTGGTITGYYNDQANGNVVKDANGEILGRRGHAIAVGGADRRKESTSGPEDNLSLSGSTATGAWDG